ncbi:MAG: sulfite exporter TauE/SafE family protein [Hymenobacter sp.]|nr:sulfite exporter TauE/SafE family protein [Hymenobacter sp.]
MDYIILFAAAFFAATVSASVGFGGALIFLPILAHIVGIKEAVPVLTIAQLFGNGSRFWFGRHELKWTPVLYFLLGSVPCAIISSSLYSGMKADWLFRVVGGFLILVVLYRRLNIKKIEAGNLGMVFGGALTGFLSGLTGSAGPTGALFFLGLNLSPVVYIASDAFASLVLHFTKIIVYSKYSLINTKGLLVGAFAGAAMIGGSYAGKVLLSKVSKERFLLIVEVLIVLSGLQMIFFA